MAAAVSNAHTKLIHVLRSACSGELAAGHAYRGHWKSVLSEPTRERIRAIEAEEWHHRTIVRSLLADLGSGPSAGRETVFWLIGKQLASSATLAVGSFRCTELADLSLGT